MKITVIGRGNIGGGLADRWEKAGHTVTRLGRDGGDAADADAVLVAVPSAAIADALGKVSGLENARALEDHLGLLMAIRAELGPFFYRYAKAGEL